ncbi:hypothetical protein F0U60_44055 [Archangium minus]|uniref:Cell surface protein n=1 Tax=Archangium minus TaxID=83450 RepID=A0ABY9X4K6_9BACT|nr:hypothetical protein F0U60_44055 [Archangium minus]
MQWRDGMGVVLAAVVGLGAGDALAQPGAHLWSLSFGDISQQGVEDVAVDASGNTVLVGEYGGGAFDLGGGALPPNNYYWNLYVAKRDGTGAHVWSRAIPGVSDDDFGFVDYERQLAVDAAGNILLAGNYYGTPDFGCGPLSQGTGSVFVVKLSPTGACVWSRGFPGAYVNTPRIAVDGTGRVAVAGFFNGTLDFGGGALSSTQGLFLARLSASGRHLWSKRFEPTSGGTFAPRALGIASDGTGNVLLTGGFSGYVSFGGTAMRSRGGQDLFVARFNPTGGLTWGRRFGDAADQVGHGIASDAAGNGFVTGGFGGTLAMDTVVLGAGSASDAFVVRLDTTGHGVWGRRFTDASGTQHGAQVTVDAAGNIAASGEYTGAIDLGEGPLPGSGNVRRYVAKLDGAGGLLWGLAFVGDGFDLHTAVDAAGDVRVAGSYTENVSLAGVPYTAQGGFGAYDIFVARFSH